MKALITGSAGFVGQHLAEHLSNEGDEVFCSDLSLGGPDLLDPAGINDLVSRIRQRLPVEARDKLRAIAEPI